MEQVVLVTDTSLLRVNMTKEERREYNRKDYLLHKEERKEKKAANYKRWAEEHKAHLAEYQRGYRKKQTLKKYGYLKEE